MTQFTEKPLHYPLNPQIYAEQLSLGGFTEMKKIKVDASHSKISGNLVISDTVQDSFNSIDASKSSDDIKALLLELGKAVDEMIKKVPKNEIKGVEDDYKRLVDESLKESPKEKWYSVSVKGLQDAVLNLVKLGNPS